ncbi:MAG: ABC transporter ATP-binding protein [Chloroflexota bacterium]
MLQLRNVSLGYNGCVVVQGVSLDATPGMMLGLIGPNGSGKSTLIRGMCGLLRASAGSISLGTGDIQGYRRDELGRLIATVPQDPTIPDSFTAFEVVLMGRTPHLGLLRYEGEHDRRIAWQAMEATRTQQFADRRVGELSGGERRRVVIARALAQQPKVFLLDEPTAHLDIKCQVEVLDLARRLCRGRGLTVVVALHDLNLAAQYCDWLVMLKRGRAYTQGVAPEVLTEENIWSVYGAEVCIYPHPMNGLPITVAVTSHGTRDGAVSR